MVSFYDISRQDFEAFVGIGVVSHTQTDRKIQITLIYVEREQESFAERLRHNDAEAMRNTLVKPGYPKRFTDYLIQGGHL
jgi:hypothetical protein